MENKKNNRRLMQKYNTPRNLDSFLFTFSVVSSYITKNQFFLLAILTVILYTVSNKIIGGENERD